MVVAVSMFQRFWDTVEVYQRFFMKIIISGRQVSLKDNLLLLIIEGG